jgi:hypothetical protein
VTKEWPCCTGAKSFCQLAIQPTHKKYFQQELRYLSKVLFRQATKNNDIVSAACNGNLKRD